MIINRPNMHDYEAYLMLPAEDKWIMNKLAIAEKQGLQCGPEGVPIPEGEWCIRPQMNLRGGGLPGVFKHTAGPNGMNNTPRVPGGYFWCEWLTGDLHGVDYLNDVPIKSYGGPFDQDGNITDYGPRGFMPELPDWLKNKAKYLTVEYIGNTIIEVTPRWQWIIDSMVRVNNNDGSFYWEYTNGQPQTEE